MFEPKWIHIQFWETNWIINFQRARPGLTPENGKRSCSQDLGLPYPKEAWAPGVHVVQPRGVSRASTPHAFVLWLLCSLGSDLLWYLVFQHASERPANMQVCAGRQEQAALQHSTATGDRSRATHTPSQHRKCRTLMGTPSSLWPLLLKMREMEQRG